ncbi:hypothetical protein H8356DRAFT_1418130 [Neocallimastix lanati (nom. inval.)]|nr:hypothetical protein H8356DRAFT_1418130 [Neocallimastix sp. JGI-2020a]
MGTFLHAPRISHCMRPIRSNRSYFPSIEPFPAFLHASEMERILKKFHFLNPFICQCASSLKGYSELTDCILSTECNCYLYSRRQNRKLDYPYNSSSRALRIDSTNTITLIIPKYHQTLISRFLAHHTPYQYYLRKTINYKMLLFAFVFASPSMTGTEKMDFNPNDPTEHEWIDENHWEFPFLSQSTRTFGKLEAEGTGVLKVKSSCVNSFMIPNENIDEILEENVKKFTEVTKATEVTEVIEATEATEVKIDNIPLLTDDDYVAIK